MAQKSSELRLIDFEFQSEQGQDKLGKGAFANVHKVRHLSTQRVFAIKICDLSKAKVKSQYMECLRREIKLHSTLDHENIVKMVGHFVENKNLHIILEFAENGNLFKYIKKQNYLSEPEAFRLFKQICMAVQYLHSKGILHRDIKPENILLDSKNNAKLCDFGWSVMLEADSQQRDTFCGTLEYIAPELFFSENYGAKADVWALGILLYEMLHGTAPFKGSSMASISQRIKEGDVKFSRRISSQAADLIMGILVQDPEKRASIEEILLHPLFQPLKVIPVRLNSSLSKLCKSMEHITDQRQPESFVTQSPLSPNLDISEQERIKKTVERVMQKTQSVMVPKLSDERQTDKQSVFGATAPQSPNLLKQSVPSLKFYKSLIDTAHDNSRSGLTVDRNQSRMIGTPKISSQKSSPLLLNKLNQTQHLSSRMLEEKNSFSRSMYGGDYSSMVQNSLREEPQSFLISRDKISSKVQHSNSSLSQQLLSQITQRKHRKVSLSQSQLEMSLRSLARNELITQRADKSKFLLEQKPISLRGRSPSSCENLLRKQLRSQETSINWDTQSKNYSGAEANLIPYKKNLQKTLFERIATNKNQQQVNLQKLDSPKAISDNRRQFFGNPFTMKHNAPVSKERRQSRSREFTKFKITPRDISSGPQKAQMETNSGLNNEAIHLYGLSNSSQR